jgi:hypothetical protein
MSQRVISCSLKTAVLFEKSRMRSFNDLPPLLLERITHLARDCRQILGTNKYACVCRQWQEASSSDNPEPLQLFVDLRFMSVTNNIRASKWTAMHGRQVEVLVMEASGIDLHRLTWVPAAAGGLSRLKRLDFEQQHSLSLLAPVLGQLPCLQQLSARVTMKQASGNVWGYEEGNLGSGGVLVSHQGGARWEYVPDLQQLCPQLTQLRLTMDHSEDCSCTVKVDPQLPRLMPPGLKQLTLASLQDYGSIVLPSSSLSHLTALQQLVLEAVVLYLGKTRGMAQLGALRQLTLNVVDVRGPGAATLAQDLAALQQLRFSKAHLNHYSWRRNHVELQLGAKVVEYQASELPHVSVTTGLVHLTRLVCGAHNQGITGVLAAAPDLQELVLGSDGEGPASILAAGVMQHVAGLVQLCHLHLNCHVSDPAAFSSSLAQCTQLTSVGLLIPGAHVYGAETFNPMLGALQQLAGLRCLTVSPGVLELEAGAWLAPLTALTRLCVKLADHPDELCWYDCLLPDEYQPEGWEATQYPSACRLLGQVQVWPAGLQQVVYWAAKAPGTRGNMPQRWEHIPAAPGSAPICVWLEETGPFRSESVARGWARPWRPCPHLPCVWELLGECGSLG